MQRSPAAPQEEFQSIELIPVNWFCRASSHLGRKTDFLKIRRNKFSGGMPEINPFI